ncbi:MAG TPA: hypothetical protein DCZ94_18665 [Lentisphaeria bacterium]|nr:MAG: hypothetical protein A2X48_06005 [Lentisphaerae bacterium GWF2_49_21]HBC88969.1 hypothetical protein [Lentisphaeria bacterium]
MPSAALTLLCKDKFSVDNVITEAKWINEKLGDALKNKTIHELINPNIRTEIENNMSEIIQKEWIGTGQKPNIQKVILRELFIEKEVEEVSAGSAPKKE